MALLRNSVENVQHRSLSICRGDARVARQYDRSACGGSTLQARLVRLHNSRRRALVVPSPLLRLSGYLICLLSFAVLLAGCGSNTPSSAPATRAPVLYTLKVGPAAAQVRLATTPEARTQGLSGNISLGVDEGMLFVFPAPEIPAFWMKDTHTPLSIAFITPKGAISDIMDMAPETLDLHAPRVPAIMALEMPAGWFAKRGVKPGDQVVLPARLDPRDVR